MNKVYSAVIIGGGASGLFCAIELLKSDNAFDGKDILILERNDRVGKKLIATGNGQGNLTNEVIGTDNYYGDRDFVIQFIKQLKEIDLENYLTQLNIPLYRADDGKIYPLSRQASAVLDIIRSYLGKKDCDIKTGEKVIDLDKTGDIWTIKTESDRFFAKNVVLATGGKAQSQFGTDGQGYKLAEKFNHKLTPLYPSLVQLKTDTSLIKGLKGLKETAKVNVINKGKTIKSATGDLLFTDFGVSGSSIFMVSSAVANLTDCKLVIEFLPSLNESDIEKIITDRLNCEYIEKQDILCGIINKRIGQAVLKTVKNFTAKCIAKALKNFTLDIKGSLGFNYAQVTRGGIITKDINPLTYESKLVDNLYVIGEMLDVDGDCGGYNLTFAFTSAICSARAIKRGRN